MYLAVCLAVVAVTYLVNTATITVFYHRGLAHRGLAMKPWVERAVILGGNWITGLDPKGWVCMHRLHHAHSDTKKDPHSPVHAGIFGLLYKQLRAYKRVLIGLACREERYLSVVHDLDFDVSWLNKRRLWYLPYLLHLAIGIAFGAVFGWWLLGACYFVGMMSHPVEGWLVNAFGHAIGGRNFDTDDNSRNNHLVAWLVVGEGFQNNHHRYPSSPRFSYRWYEIDPGYGVCWLLDKIGLVRIHRDKLMPRPG
jgi:stearoyl-CoA desaturase (delta-9 desaturase)